MTNIDLSIEKVYGPRPHINHKVGLIERIIFVGFLVAGLLFAGFNLVNDITVSGDIAITWLPYILLGIETHLTYAQGASAELVAMATIGVADMSTTQVLSSGVAEAMTANKSGFQWRTFVVWLWLGF